MVTRCTAAATSPPPPSTSLPSITIAHPASPTSLSPPVHAPRAPPIATHHITGEPTYVALDGHPFFCPISCDSCTCPGLRYIVDENCPCTRCTTFATAPVATPTDIIAQRRRRLGNVNNIHLNDLQHLSEGDLFERLYPIHHTSQENPPELTALARVNQEDALPTDPNNATSWLAFRHSIRRLSYDINVQHQQRPAPGGGYGHFNHRASFVEGRQNRHRKRSLSPQRGSNPKHRRLNGGGIHHTYHFLLIFPPSLPGKISATIKQRLIQD
ncbi:hypothetical protein BOTBODRAFT_173159 [Botryobasidium botryosum FD-172 SS1]|uniref:Uncharacterized protein n=1 Tax=Botryobasidium botryosum (strain FD-172 SS1) TaxID=930990 RepID=A0A067MXI0_BOTB1|nr:hypothetical protein BOTBODRAFT_173159 [Botryobasidium botryosum FD-172 SS1]